MVRERKLSMTKNFREKFLALLDEAFPESVPKVKATELVSKVESKTVKDTPKVVHKAGKAPQKASKKRPSIDSVRYRLVVAPTAQTEYLQELLTPACATHNAAVAKALRGAGKTGLTFAELVATIRQNGWKTTSPNPEGILRWHLRHLERDRQLIEKVS